MLLLIIKESRKVAKTIYCPQCGRKVMTYDEKAKNIQRTACNKCNKLVIYKPSIDEVKLDKIPPRNTSSGMRYY